MILVDLLVLWWVCGIVAILWTAITDGLTVGDVPTAFALTLLGPLALYEAGKHCTPRWIKDIELIPWHWSIWRRRKRR